MTASLAITPNVFILVADRVDAGEALLGFSAGLSATLAAAGISLVWAVALYFLNRNLRRQIVQQAESHDELNALFETTFESLNDAIIVEDFQGNVIAKNSRFTKLFSDQSDHNIESKSRVAEFVQHVIPHDVAERLFSKHRNLSKTSISLEFATNESPPRSLLVSSVPIHRRSNSSGQAVGRVWLFRDETDRKLLERQLLQAQKMESVGTLASGIAHDLNNILCSVANSLAVVGLDHLTDAQNEAIDLANDHVFRAADVLRRLLDFSDSQPLRKEKIALNNLIAESLALLRHMFDSTIQFEVSYSEDAGFVNVDRTMFEQVIMNLCVNARDAMDGRGVITIKTIPLGNAGTNSVLFSIGDHGRGIEAEDHDRIFDPFYSTKRTEGGTGLGLSVTYRIVNQHGGSIRCESNPDKGATFFVSLPLADEPTEAPGSENSEKDALPLQHQRILVVDDTPAVLDSVSRILRRVGIQVDIASTADGALGILNKTAKPHDVIIIDLTMPGTSGDELLSTVKSLFPNVRTILTSGYPPNQRQEEKACPDIWLTKPYSIGELLQRLAELAGPPPATI